MTLATLPAPGSEDLFFCGVGALSLSVVGGGDRGAPLARARGQVAAFSTFGADLGLGPL